MMKLNHGIWSLSLVFLSALTISGCGEDKKDETTTEADPPVVVATSGAATTPAATAVTLASINTAVVATLKSVQASENGLLRGGGNQSGAAEPADSGSGDPYCDTNGNPISGNSASNTSSNDNVRFVSGGSNLYPAGQAYCLFSPRTKVSSSIYNSYADGAVLMCLLGTITYDGAATSKTLAYSADFKTCLGDEYDSRYDGQIWLINYTATKIGNPLDIAATAGFDHKVDLSLSINGTTYLTTNLGYKSRSDAIMLGQFSLGIGEASGEATLFSIDPTNGVMRYELYQPGITYSNSYSYATHLRSRIDGTWDLTKGFTAITGFGVLSSYTYDYRASLASVTPDATNPQLSAYSYTRSIVGDFKTGLVSRNYLGTCRHGSSCELGKVSSYTDISGITGYCVIPANTYKCPGVAGVPMAADSDFDFATFGASPQSAKDWFGSIAAPLAFKDIPTTATVK